MGVAEDGTPLQPCPHKFRRLMPHALIICSSSCCGIGKGNRTARTLYRPSLYPTEQSEDELDFCTLYYIGGYWFFFSCSILYSSSGLGAATRAFVIKRGRLSSQKIGSDVGTVSLIELGVVGE